MMLTTCRCSSSSVSCIPPSRITMCRLTCTVPCRSHKVGRGEALNTSVIVHAQRRHTIQSQQHWPAHSIQQDLRSAQHIALAHAAQHPAPEAAPFWPSGSSVTLAYALSQVELLAAPGSSWPPEQQAAFTKAADLTSGFWVLTQCGEWDQGQKLEGQPARMLTQMVFCLVDEPTPEAVEAARRSRRQVPLSVSVVRQPAAVAPPGTEQVVGHLVYELDANGWPTGALLNSASGVVMASTRHKMAKADYAFNVISEGRLNPNKLRSRGCTLGTWKKRVLQSLPAVQKADRKQAWYVQRYLHNELHQQGLTVQSKPDGADLHLERLRST